MVVGWLVVVVESGEFNDVFVSGGEFCGVDVGCDCGVEGVGDFFLGCWIGVLFCVVCDVILMIVDEWDFV